MKTVLLQANQIQTAATILKQGGLVVFPTETVYGLGANGLDGEAVAKIFVAKGRPSDNPLILHIHNEAQLADLVTEVSNEAKQLINAFWPGALTLIFHKTAIVPKEVSAGLSTVGIRMPNQPLALALLQAVNGPLAAPSANRSGRPSSTTLAHVMTDLDGRVDAVLDGGDTLIGMESTVLDTTTSPCTILRPGEITKAMIEQVLGQSIAVATDIPSTPKSPGTKYNHYQPAGELLWYYGALEAIQSQLANTQSVIIAPKEWAPSFDGARVVVLGSLADPSSMRKEFYALLREMDAQSVKQMVLVTPKLSILEEDLVDRFEKASTSSMSVESK
jgi:L-threonylcarbamoyladenylate synthase